MGRQLCIRRIFAMILAFICVGIISLCFGKGDVGFYLAGYLVLFLVYIAVGVINYSFRVSNHGPLHFTAEDPVDTRRHGFKIFIGLLATFFLTIVCLTLAQKDARFLHPGVLFAILVIVQMVIGPVLAIAFRIGPLTIHEFGYSSRVFRFVSWNEVIDVKPSEIADKLVLTLGDNSLQPVANRTFRVDENLRDEVCEMIRSLLDKYSDPELRNRLKLGYPPKGIIEMPRIPLELR